MNKKVIIVVFLLLIGFGIYYFVFYNKQNLVLPTIQNLQEKQEVSIEGIYIKNTRDEGVADGGSYQIIDTKDYGQVKIVVGGFRSNCLAKEIYQPSKGDKVEVYGVVISDPNNNFFNGNELSICTSDKYYIRKIIQQEVSQPEKIKESVSFISAKIEQNVELYMENHYQKNFSENKVACATKVYGYDEKYIYTWMYCQEYGQEPASAGSGAVRFEYKGGDFQIIALTEQAEGDSTTEANKKIFGEYYNSILVDGPTSGEGSILQQEVQAKIK